MEFIYKIHGVRIVSNRQLVGLCAVNASQGDCHFSLSISIIESPDVNLDGFADCTGNKNIDEVINNNPFRRSYSYFREDGAFVEINHGKTVRLQVTYADQGRQIGLDWWSANYNGFEKFSEFLVTYLLGNILAIALRLSGRLVLHGNAVHIGNRSVAWIGSSGAGKSTLSAAFLAAGYPLITDNQLVISKTSTGWHPAQGIPRLRINPQSLRACSLALSDTYQSPRKPNMKGWLAFAQNESNHPRILGAIFILDRRQTGMMNPVIERLDGGNSLRGLLENRFGIPSVQLNEPGMKAEFSTCTQLAATVPIMRLVLPDNLEYLSGAVQEIVDVIAV